MSLETYESVRPWARSIKQRVHQAADAAVVHRQVRRHPEIFERPLADRRRDQHHREAGWTRARPSAIPRICRLRNSGPNDEGWQLAEAFGQPDFIIKSDPYTMPAVAGSVVEAGGRPPVTEARWVRAVEMRPGTAQGRKITHHAIAHLVQNDPDAERLGGDDSATANQGGVLMEWAVGKNFDVYPKTPASCCCPARRCGGTSTITPSAKRSVTTSNSASGSIRKIRSRSIGPI